MARSRMGFWITSLFATLASMPAPAAIDPALMQAKIADALRLNTALQPRVSRWQIEPGKRACVLRDAGEAGRARVQFIRETGRISLWLAPRADDLPANPLSAQAYQLYFVPIDGDPKGLVASEIGVALWQEPLSNSAAPGFAANLDPGAMLKKYPAGVGIILAQGQRTVFADVLTPDVAAMLPEFEKCRGGR